MIPTFDLSRLLGLAINAARMAAYWIAFKALALVIVGTLVPLAIYAGWKLIQSSIYSAAQSAQPETWQGAVIQFTGIGAYIADELYLAQALGIVLGAMAVGWTLSWLKR